MGISTAVAPPAVVRLPIWWVNIRDLGAGNTARSRLLLTNAQDSGSLGQVAPTGYIGTNGDNALGAYGVHVDYPIDSSTLGQEVVLRTTDTARSPVEYYLAPLGTLGARPFSEDQLWEVRWGPTVVFNVTDATAGQSMWAGVGFGGGVAMDAAGAWNSAGFLGWLWDIRTGAGGAGNWSCAFRQQNGTYRVNVDSGLSIGTMRDLSVQVGQDNGDPVVRWFADGGLVHEEQGPVAGYVPDFLNAEDWGPCMATGREDSFADGFEMFTAMTNLVRLDAVVPLQ